MNWLAIVENFWLIRLVRTVAKFNDVTVLWALKAENT